MGFQFRLQSVLNLRQQSRDLKRQEVIEQREAYANAVSIRDSREGDRASVLKNLKSLQSDEIWDVAAITQCLRYAETLADELIKADQTVSELLSQLNFSLQTLISADQSVRALELLAEKQQAEFQRFQSNREQRHCEDTVSSCRRVA